jgi:ABC-type antimicrobial peptide transport system permease subunit
VYLPQSQSTDSYLTLVIRAPGQLQGLQDQVRREVAALANDVPVYSVVPFEDLQTAAAGTRVFMMKLLALFAAAAVLLATVGLYGVISQAVLGREREIGIRVSLGASRSEVAGLILKRGLMLIGLGLFGGLAASAMASGFLEAQLFETAAIDPAPYTIGAIALLTAGLLAHALPLRRAMHVDPNLVLRGD